MSESSVREPDGTGCDSTGDPRLDDLFDRAEQMVQELGRADLTSLVRLDGPSTGLHTAGARVERIRRAFQAVDTAYVTALEEGDEARRNGCPSTAVFLRVQLRLSPGEAKARVKAAGACSVRTEFAVGSLPPERPLLAAARAAGAVSSDHASVILDALDRIPDTVATEDVDAAEARLVAEAAVFDPGGVARLGRRILDHIDPDGTLRDDSWKQRTRAATLFRNSDGTGTLRARLTPEALETWQTVLDPLCRPLPTGPDGPDPRSPEQRVHDGLLDAGVRLLNSGELPASGGTPTTIVVHLTQEQYAAQVSQSFPESHSFPASHSFPESQSGPAPQGIPESRSGPAPQGVPPAQGVPNLPLQTEPSNVMDPPNAKQRRATGRGEARSRPSGLVETEHGNLLPLGSAFRMADQAAICTLLTDSRDVPLQLGRTTRIATPGQTIALAARDRGCTFPSCDRPAAWAERHHVTPWYHDGDRPVQPCSGLRLSPSDVRGAGLAMRHAPRPSVLDPAGLGRLASSTDPQHVLRRLGRTMSRAMSPGQWGRITGGGGPPWPGLWPGCRRARRTRGWPV
jgi:Domain of unknown function (DUF222)